MFRELLSWREASDKCESHGGDLPRWKTARDMQTQNDDLHLLTLFHNFFDVEVPYNRI